MRGCALVYVKKKLQPLIHPIATSHNYNRDFQENFFDVGTDDLTNYLIVPEALAYYNKLGGRMALTNHASNLLEIINLIYRTIYIM